MAHQRVGLELGHWILNASSSGPRITGCILDTDARATVVEFSFVHVGASGEGTIDHHSWYLIAAVDESASGYNFDRVRGAGTPAVGGCNAADVAARPVPAPTIVGRDPLDCIGNGMPTTGANNANPAYFDITVDLADATPEYFNEVGLNDPTWRLIEGYEVLFRTGAEPTTSDECEWTPVRHPANPATTELGTVPYGTRRVVVSIPKMLGMDQWLAVRLVYTDCSVNGSRVLDPACSVPRPPGRAPLGSKVSSHCGPVVEP